MKKLSLIFSSALLALLIASCGGGVKNTEATENVEATENTEATDGNQEWMTENLNVDKFRNGDPIPEAKTDEEWEKAGDNREPAWCYYDNDPANGEKYGKLYNWYAVNDPRGLAPKGWHVPSDEEWTTLTDHLGGENVAVTKMKSTSGWGDNGDESSNGTNESRFSGLPGGSRNYIGAFFSSGIIGNWWSSTEADTDFAWSLNLGYYGGDVGRDGSDKASGFSVRCLRD
jgi:uncharacterized protein (TIGR02145 family)